MSYGYPVKTHSENQSEKWDKQTHPGNLKHKKVDYILELVFCSFVFFFWQTWWSDDGTIFFGFLQLTGCTQHYDCYDF